MQSYSQPYDVSVLDNPIKSPSTAVYASASLAPEGTDLNRVAHVLDQELVQSQTRGVCLQLSIADWSDVAPFSGTVALVTSQETDTLGSPQRFVRDSLLYHVLILMIIPAPKWKNAV